MNIDQVVDFLTLKVDMNDCISNCSGNGICKLVDNNKKLMCECFANYAGSKCDINTLPCSSNPCRNNGTCVDNLLNKTYTCECYSEYNQTSLYHGHNCENKKDVCEGEKCSFNGICIDFGNEAKCKCFRYFSGSRCEIESNEIKSVKMVTSDASIIAIIILLVSFLSLIILDVSNLVFKIQHTKKYPVKQNPPRKFIYVN